LGEENATSSRPHRLQHARKQLGVLVALAATASLLVACGDDSARQDADEPTGEFRVDVTDAKFPDDQRLAETNYLRLAFENAGDDVIPDLAVTIWTGDTKASKPFSIYSDQPDLADPNRPVWILEDGYPKCIDDDKVPPCIPSDQSGLKDIREAGSAGAEAAQTDTFSFGELQPNESLEAVWALTPVQAGHYPVHYEVAAGLTGKAEAVTQDGSPVEGEFLVSITDKPPRARVNDAGQVKIQGD
jgi:hypothetical protein